MLFAATASADCVDKILEKPNQAPQARPKNESGFLCQIASSPRKALIIQSEVISYYCDMITTINVPQLYRSQGQNLSS